MAKLRSLGDELISASQSGISVASSSFGDKACRALVVIVAGDLGGSGCVDISGTSAPTWSPTCRSVSWLYSGIFVPRTGFTLLCSHFCAHDRGISQPSGGSLSAYMT